MTRPARRCWDERRWSSWGSRNAAPAFHPEGWSEIAEGRMALVAYPAGVRGRESSGVLRGASYQGCKATPGNHLASRWDAEHCGSWLEFPRNGKCSHRRSAPRHSTGVQEHSQHSSDRIADAFTLLSIPEGWLKVARGGSAPLGRRRHFPLRSQYRVPQRGTRALLLWKTPPQIRRTVAR